VVIVAVEARIMINILAFTDQVFYIAVILTFFKNPDLTNL
jgi:hypothetical protein